MLGIGIGLGLMGNPAATSGGGGGAATTFSPSTSLTTADFALSPDKLTATRTANTTFHAYARSTTAKVSGSVIFTIVAVGAGSFAQVGLDTGAEIDNLGHDATGVSIGYGTNGQISFAGAVWITAATLTAGDKAKFDKDVTGKNITISKWNTGTSAWDVQYAFDVTSGGYGVPAAPVQNAAYPTVHDGNSTGLQVTANFTGW